MEDDRLHLDHALSEEFAGHAETIHNLKTTDAHFANLLTKNRELWDEIQKIQSGVEPTEDSVLEQLEKQRLVVLDDIAARIKAAEG